MSIRLWRIEVGFKGWLTISHSFSDSAVAAADQLYRTFASGRCCRRRHRLVLRPHDCVIECPSGFLAGKIPLDHDLIAIRATVPSSRFPPQRGAISDPAATQALPGVQADGDLCLVQPTAMLRGVVHREPLPQPLALLRAETLDDRLASVRTQIIHDQ